MFDPYSEWLGVTGERRPPTLYQLLGITPVELDAQIIDRAATRQMMRIQQFLGGSEGPTAKRILGEIALARTTLLDPARRAAYDAVFGEKPKEPRKVPPVQPGAWSDPESDVELVPIPTPKTKSTPSRPQPEPAAPIRSDARPKKEFSFLDDSDPTHASPEFQPPSSSDGYLPTPKTAFRRKPPAASSQKMLFVMVGAVVLAGIVGGVFFLRGNSNKPDEGKKQEVAKNDKPRAEPTPTPTPKEKKKLPAHPNEVPTPKKTPPKTIPKNDPPPPAVAPETEFKQSVIYRGHQAVARGLAVAPDGKHFLSVADDNAVLSWQPGTEKSARRYTLKSQGMAAAFLPNSTEALFCDGGFVYLINLADNKILREFINPAGGIQALGVASDGKHFITACTDGAMRWWDIAEAKQPERTIEFVKETPVDCLSLSKEGNRVIAGGRDGSLTMWDLSSGKSLKKFAGHPGGVSAVAFSPDGKRAASVGSDLLLRVWDVASGKELFHQKGHTAVPIAVAYTPDSSLIVSTGLDQTIRFWNALSGETWRSLHKADEKIHSLAIDPKNRFLIAGLGDGGILLSLLPAVRPDSPDPLLMVQGPPPQRFPVPNSNVLEVASKAMEERYKADFGLTTMADRLVLIDKLLLRAKYAPEDPDFRYALFQGALDLADKTGRVDEAMRIVDERSKWFETDELAEKSLVLRNSVLVTPEVARTTIETAVMVVEQAEKQARPDIVDEMLRKQELFAQGADTPELNARIMTVKKHWEDDAKLRERIDKQLAALEKDATDKDANLGFGKVLCFHEGDWSRGLGYLEKSGDATLIEFARREKANPTDGKLQFELADAWIAYLAKTEEEFKPGVVARALYWYRAAEKSNLSAVEKLQVNGKKQQAEKMMPVGFSGFVPGNAVVRSNFNTMRSPLALETQWSFNPSVEATKEGIALKGDATMRSRFLPQQNWRIVFGLVPDGRELILDLCGTQIKVKPAVSSVVVPWIVNRNGNILTYRLGSSETETTIEIPEMKREPTLLMLKVAGAAEKDPLTIKIISVTGSVKPTQ